MICGIRRNWGDPEKPLRKTSKLLSKKMPKKLKTCFSPEIKLSAFFKTCDKKVLKMAKISYQTRPVAPIMIKNSKSGFF